MPDRYFTLEEANGQIPMLERTFGRLLRIRAQLRVLYRHLDEAGYAPGDEHFEVAPEGTPPEVARDRARFKGLVESLRDDLEALRRAGCLVKDLDTGLVDWRARAADRDVLLCWRLGEKEVSFWHDAEAGVAGRRPVAELAPAAGPPPAPPAGTTPRLEREPTE